MSRRERDANCYPSVSRGLCIIINNDDFHDWPVEERRGVESENDAIDLQILFEKLKFSVEIRRNCQAREIETLFQRYIQAIHRYCCIFVIVMSHGRNIDEILTYDKKLISTQKIVENFSERNCPSLAGKPKVFIFQTCKGRYRGNFTSPDSIQCEATHKDTLIVHSMVEGTLPISNFHGTWYIREFIKAVEEYGEDKHLVDILTIVNSVVMESTIAPGFRQTPEITDCFSKKFYLKPQAEPSTTSTPLLHNQYPRGYCIIINNLGSARENDIKSLSKLMREDLGFYVVPFTNLSALATTRFLGHVCKAVTDSKEQCCLFVAIFAAGSDKCFKASDKKEVSFQETRDIFGEISDKSKIFLFHIQLEETTSKAPHSTNDKQPLISSNGASTNDDTSSVNDQVFQAIFTHHPSHCPTYIPQLVSLMRQSANIAPVNEILRDACQYEGNGQATCLCPVRKLCLPLIDPLYGPSNIAFTACEFKMALKVWSPMRGVTIDALSKKKQELITLGSNIRISKIAGSSASIVGGVTTVVGLALTPFTFGTSLIIAGIGAGVAALGGVTTVSATIADAAITKRTLKEASEVLKVDDQLCQIVDEIYTELKEQADKISDKSNISREDVIVTALQGGEHILRLGMAAFAGGMAAGGVGTIEGGILATRIGGAALGGPIVGGVLAVAVMPINIYDLATNAYRLSHSSPTAAVENIEKQLKELERQRKKVNKMLEATPSI